MVKIDIIGRAFAPDEVEPKRQPSNFAYTTLSRISREQREAERRQRVTADVCVVVVMLFGLYMVGYFFGRDFLRWLMDAFSHSADLSFVPAALKKLKNTNYICSAEIKQLFLQSLSL